MQNTKPEKYNRLISDHYIVRKKNVEKQLQKRKEILNYRQNYYFLPNERENWNAMQPAQN